MLLRNLFEIFPELPWPHHAARVSVVRMRQQVDHARDRAQRAVLRHNAILDGVRAEWLWRTWLFNRDRSVRGRHPSARVDGPTRRQFSAKTKR
jgi:hypothetical protein